MTRLDRWIAFLISLAALTVYALTLTPSLSYLSPDGSELATVPYVLGLAHSPGYPLFTWLGFLFSRLLPLGDVAHRINLMSAVMGALAAGGLYWILIRLLPESIPPALRRSAAALSVLLLAFSKTFWAQSLIAEVYAPNAAGIVLTLLALLRWERTRRPRDFFLFALAFGLSLGLHLSDLGFAPAFILFILLSLFEPAPPPAEKTQPSNGATFRTRFRSLVAVACTGLLGFALGAAQFLWLPLQSATLNDRAMLRSAPTTLAGIYNYTLGAFPNFKFAFALTALPDRLVIYLDLLNQQFGLPGIGLGILGLFSLLARRTRHFFLLVGMYLVQIWFFIQYSAFDLDVFFIPAHLLWAVFIGFGLHETIRAGQFAYNRIVARARAQAPNDIVGATGGRPYRVQILSGAAGCLLILFAAPSVRLAYDTRPDILLPLLPGPNPSANDLAGRDLFATTRALTGNMGPGALPGNLFNQNSWSIPVLFGQQPEESFGRREALVLYHLTADPPPLLEFDPHPQFAVDEDLGPVQLLGYDLSSQRVESGEVLYLTMYWKLKTASSLRVETRLGDLSLEQHEIGFGLLARYAQSVRLSAGSVISESYGLVIPSVQEPGLYAFTVRTAGLGGAPGNEIELCFMDVINETGTMERWLQIAGR
jgi:hypothetical protein